MKRKALTLKTLSLKTLAVAAALALSSTAALSASAADAPAAQAPSTHTPLLWKVSDGDNSLYLLGSIHVLKKSDYPLSPDVDAAMRDAKTVIFELDMDAMMKPDSLAKMQQSFAFEDGRKLGEVLPADTRAKLEALFAKTGTPFSSAEGIEPWAINMQLAMGLMMGMGFDPQAGIDMHLTREAKAAGKTLLALETLQDQLEVFEASPESEQIGMLDKFLSDPRQAAQASITMHADWKAGNIEGLDRSLRQKMAVESPESYRLLNTARNDRWVPKLQARLDGHGKGDNSLAVVGALHLLGADGVVEKLRAKGYRVERVCTGCDTARQ
ncbi:TraB/GumN family protein [Lysobacter brunescens]|uniref:TraB/GumN family protein n=1 Tax=Lysobacter brunescens TaxID=262323 RepID=A0ABW2YDA9_9GAMM